MACSDNRELRMPCFFNLWSVQTLSFPKVIDRIKKELFEAKTITRKIILEGGLVVADGVSGDEVIGGGSGSGSGATIGDNHAPLEVLEITNYYVYDHTGFTDFFPSSECSAWKYQGCKTKHNGVINVDVIVKAITEQHNITVDNPSTALKYEEKVKPPEVFQNEEVLINIIKVFNILDGLPWHLVDEVYIPINCGDEFHWVYAVVILKKRHIRVLYSMLGRRYSRPSSEIQKLAKILPTYLNIQVPYDGLDVGLLRKRYGSLLWKYGEAKAQKSYAREIKDPR
ncbi:hypothetical protein FXO38_31020 [Capsicum annuum]|uniref:Ubiquitin-like protease family profile domain-containing protein n=1 Tax=Capsicum annuum TaxID=4072 RepID=A0A2G2Z8P6_CAPAN|nr:hypothetical protein FXO38_31020 [Capsicum annuum]PHT78377.1 hypothetical protein T459_16429 [Capsicum annuum]